MRSSCTSEASWSSSIAAAIRISAPRPGRGLRRGARADTFDSRKMIGLRRLPAGIAKSPRPCSAFHLVQHELQVAELVGEKRIRRPDCRSNGVSE